MGNISQNLMKLQALSDVECVLFRSVHEVRPLCIEECSVDRINSFRYVM